MKTENNNSNLQYRKNNSYVFSITIDKGNFRHVQIDGNETLTQFGKAITKAFGFEDDHLSTFYLNNRTYDPSEEYGVPISDWIETNTKYCADDYTLDDLKLHKSKRFIYLFDFHNEWKFECKVLDVLQEPTPQWKLIKTRGENPEQYPEIEMPQWDLEIE